MFGRKMERYCPNCKEHVTSTIFTGYNIGGKTYSKVFRCPKCKNDLAKEDRLFIEEHKDSENVHIIMY